MGYDIYSNDSNSQTEHKCTPIPLGHNDGLLKSVPVADPGYLVRGNLFGRDILRRIFEEDFQVTNYKTYL